MRVNRYFQERALSKKGNALMYVKTTFYFTAWGFLYALIMSGRFSEPAMLGLALLLGCAYTGIGFNVGHDAIHGAFARNRIINAIACYAFEFNGASSYSWKVRHNVIHHTYTNIIGSDGDLESMPLLRFCARPNTKWFHRYQHFYAPLLYCFVTLVWMFKKDYKHMLLERKEQRLGRKPPSHAFAALFICKAFHYSVYLILPALFLPLPVWKVLIGFLAMHFSAGLMMATVFQIGHCVEGPQFSSRPVDSMVKDSWAVHQLKTSSNFKGGRLTNWICGGLNHQIEHHLFPTVCHVHYPRIAKIVRETASEFGLPYNEQSGYFAGLKSHLRMMRQFGRHEMPPALSFQSESPI